MLVKFVLFFGVGILLFYLTFRDQKFSNILLRIETANLKWIAVSILCTFLAQLIRVLRWCMLLDKSKSLPFSAAYHALILGYLSNLLIPRIGEVVRCTVLYKTKEIPVLTAFGTVIVERIFDLSVLLCGLIYVFIFQSDIVGAFFYENIFGPVNFIIVNYWILILIVVTTVFGIGIYLFKSFKLKTINSKVLRVFLYLSDGLNSFKHLEGKKLFVFYSVVIWFFYWMAIVACFQAFEFTHHLGFEVAFSVMIFSTLAMLTPVQAGFGVYHWLVSQCLLLYGISIQDGLSYAALMHFSHLFLTVFLGLISIVFYLKRNR